MHYLVLPILLSAVIAFVASFIIHMVLGYHKADYPKLANEDQVRDALRSLNIPPGDYFMPRPASNDDMKSPEFVEKMKQGPNVVMTVLPTGHMSMGRNLALWFLYCLGISVFAAYIASRALPHGTPTTYLQVFRFVGCTAFLGYSAALWQMSIWYHRSWGTTIRSTIDGLIYGLLTAGVFGWLWPH